MNAVLPLAMNEITQTHNVVYPGFLSVKVSMNSRLKKGGFYE